MLPLTRLFLGLVIVLVLLIGFLAWGVHVFTTRKCIKDCLGQTCEKYIPLRCQACLNYLSTGLFDVTVFPKQERIITIQTSGNNSTNSIVFPSVSQPFLADRSVAAEATNVDNSLQSNVTLRRSSDNLYVPVLNTLQGQWYTYNVSIKPDDFGCTVFAHVKDLTVPSNNVKVLSTHLTVDNEGKFTLDSPMSEIIDTASSSSLTEMMFVRDDYIVINNTVDLSYYKKNNSNTWQKTTISSTLSQPINSFEVLQDGENIVIVVNDSLKKTYDFFSTDNGVTFSTARIIDAVPDTESRDVKIIKLPTSTDEIINLALIFSEGQQTINISRLNVTQYADLQTVPWQSPSSIILTSNFRFNVLTVSNYVFLTWTDVPSPGSFGDVVIRTYDSSLQSPIGDDLRTILYGQFNEACYVSSVMTTFDNQIIFSAYVIDNNIPSQIASVQTILCTNINDLIGSYVQGLKFHLTPSYPSSTPSSTLVTDHGGLMSRFESLNFSSIVSFSYLYDENNSNSLFFFTSTTENVHVKYKVIS